MEALVVRIQDAFHGRSGADRERRLFDDNLAFVGNFQNVAGGLFPVLQVRSLASTVTKRFRRGIHRHKDDIRFLDGGRNIRTKEQVTATGALYNVIQTWFKNRKIFAIPGINT